MDTWCTASGRIRPGLHTRRSTYPKRQFLLTQVVRSGGGGRLRQGWGRGPMSGRRIRVMPRTRYRVALLAVVALAAAVSAARFGGGSEASTGERSALPAAATSAASPSAGSPNPGGSAAPEVSVGADQTGTVPSDVPLRVAVANATLTGVAVEDPQGQAVPGDLAADGAAWQSSEPLVPRTIYMVRVSAVGGTDQQPFDQTLTVTSAAPSAVLHATLSPNDGEVVGIGMPAVVTFDRPVAAADRPAVEARLSVSA